MYRQSKSTLWHQYNQTGPGRWVCFQTRWVTDDWLVRLMFILFLPRGRALSWLITPSVQSIDGKILLNKHLCLPRNSKTITAIWFFGHYRKCSCLFCLPTVMWRFRVIGIDEHIVARRFRADALRPCSIASLNRLDQQTLPCGRLASHLYWRLQIS